MPQDKIFAEGLSWFDPHQKAPDFVKGVISVNREKFIAWLERQEVNDRGYLKLDVKESQGGKYYVELNTYKPNGSRDRTPPEPAKEAPDGGGGDFVGPSGDEIPF